MTDELGGIIIHTIDHVRAKVQIGLFKLIYNNKRVVTLIGKQYFGFSRVMRQELPKRNRNETIIAKSQLELQKTLNHGH